MKLSSLVGAWIIVAACGAGAFGALPGMVPEQGWVDFPVKEAGPGAFAADGLLDKPAGKDGAIVVKGGHFYTSLVNGKRIRFWGVNFCFGACFPTHEEADRIAPRLAELGINAVRFHHMDSQPFPAGIFSDWKLETLDTVALDRLDYFIAALKKNGVYSDLNLHVSRQYTRAQKMPGADKAPDMDKMIDLFYPELIEAQKQYARDLLTHVNAYTKNPYSDEPAICMVEINNENSLFTWGGDKRLAEIPEPYAGALQGLWNQWLLRKYKGRENLAAAWNAGIEPEGKNVIGGEWSLEKHEGTAMQSEGGLEKLTLTISKVSAVSWHLQAKLPVSVKKGRYYTVRFTAQADAPRDLTVAVGQNQSPWDGLGLSDSVKIGKEPKDYELHFTATADETNARLAFIVGQKTGTVTLSAVKLAAGGQRGLLEGEDPKDGSVKRRDGSQLTGPRQRDWYDFLQVQDQAYFTGMYRFLRQEIRLHTPITGTIGLGALGTLSQTKMDFVDGHAYWDHPRFPGKPWDGKNWRIKNTPMVDSPESSTFNNLTALKVWGKPYTVTEYNHGAPNEWEAECVPLVATMAALQDWDAVYLFAYSHSGNYERDHIDSFFDISGNPVKLCAMSAGARIFLGQGVKPLLAAPPVLLTREEGVAGSAKWMSTMWEELKALHGATADGILKKQLAISFEPVEMDIKAASDKRPLSWTASGPGTGQFLFNDPAAGVFAGFVKQGQRVSLGPVSLSEVKTPFVVATLTSADGKMAMEKSPRLLLTLMARQRNHDMGWNEARTSVSDKWGKGPTQIEVVKGKLSVPTGWKVYPVSAGGTTGEALPMAAGVADLSAAKTLWYELKK